MSSDSWVVECKHVDCAGLSDFNLRVAPGEIVVLLGESGAGKTTALRLINGLIVPESGEVAVENRSTREWDAIELRRHIGTVSQNDGLFPHFSVARNVALVPELLGWEREKIEARTHEMLELVKLPPDQFAHEFPSQLSNEQRQRVGIARALAADQPILSLDEPFGNLDPLARERLRDDCADLCRELGVTAIFATRNLRDALLLADKIALLRAGKTVFFGTPQEFALAENPDAAAYRATMDLPAWMMADDEAQPSGEIQLADESVNRALLGGEIEIKEPGLRAKLKRAGRRLKNKF